ncbi:MAG: hypothetical protein R3C54_15305 [Parvularculaceae bacterium]|nr:hypothetical protein [Caulobacterales bacterium]HRX40609.1 hypothetical protein [Parvularculaceae bacterium]
MKFQLIAAAALLVAGPAFAGSWDAESTLCANAIAAEAGVDGSLYSVKTTKTRPGATKRVTVELRADGKDTLTGECKIKRGEVVGLEMEA